MPIDRSADVMTARKTGWDFATRLGFSHIETTLIAAIISELARNIVDGSCKGQIIFNVLENGSKRGLQVVARRTDEAVPTTRADESRLAGVGKLVDELTVASEHGGATTVTVKKWIG